MSFFQILDHPADLALTFTASSFSTVYELAAKALFEVLYETAAKGVEWETTEKIQGSDKEELLVNWLNRLIFLHETRGWRGVVFEVVLNSERELTAVVGWRRVDFQEESPLMEIKMATYHGLRISPVADHWQVMIIFDL